MVRPRTSALNPLDPQPLGLDAAAVAEVEEGIAV